MIETRVTVVKCQTCWPHETCVKKVKRKTLLSQSLYSNFTKYAFWRQRSLKNVVLFSDPAQELLYQRRQGFGGGGVGPYQTADAALLLPSILPSLLLLTLGALGAAYFSARLDVIEKETAERLHYLEDAIDTRLDRLEDEVKEGQKIDKKNDFKTKALCKLAGLFNNPLYDICQEGFDSTQIIGPSGHGGDGIQQF